MSQRNIRDFRRAQETIAQARAAARAASTPERARADLLAQIRHTLDSPDRVTLRRAKDDRAQAVKGYGSALDYSQGWVADSVRRYVGAISAEAAASRAEVRHTRELLAALLALHERESKTPMEQDTTEVQP